MQTIAQSSAVTQTIINALEALLTPEGLLAGVVGAATLVFITSHRHGPFVGGSLVILLMTMMIQENEYFDNTLVQPLQSLRDFSRPATYMLLLAMSLNLIFSGPRGGRSRLSFLMIAFFAFETIYLARLFYNGEYSRAGLGWIADLLVLISFGACFGKSIHDEHSTDTFAGMFGAASAGFVIINLFQLGFGYHNAIAGSRFAGVSANPQLAGYVCAVFLLFNAHLFGRSSLGSPKRLLYAGLIGVLIVLLIWSGSRTSALCAVAGLFTYYRLRLGSFALLGIVGGIAAFIGLSLFGESLEGVSRFVEGENTRREVWLRLIAEFQSAPLFGIMNSSGLDTINSSESSYLTALALMGLSGFIPLMIFVTTLAWTGLKILVARRSVPCLGTQVDLVIANYPIIVIGSVLEGYFFGILSFSVIWLYSVFGLSAFIIEAASHSRTSLGEEDADVGEGAFLTPS